MCFDVIYSGEYNVFDVTLSAYPHRAGWKNIMIIEHIGIEGTRLSSEIPHTWTDLTS
jgi:hypothetical protein